MGKNAFLTLILCSIFTLGKSSDVSEMTSDFINTYKPMAIAQMEASGIPASIILAQCIHESSWGQSPLAVNANNYFGIKCKAEWAGDNYYHIDDDKNDEGELIESCFRVYDNVESSFLDHSLFLLNRDRYQNLFALDTDDYKGWAKGLQESGYATDKNYAKKLIATIEKYQLYNFDRNFFNSESVYNLDSDKKPSKNNENTNNEEYIAILGIKIKPLYDLDWAK